MMTIFLLNHFEHHIFSFSNAFNEKMQSLKTVHEKFLHIWFKNAFTGIPVILEHIGRYNLYQNYRSLLSERKER